MLGESASTDPQIWRTNYIQSHHEAEVPLYYPSWNVERQKGKQVESVGSVSTLPLTGYCYSIGRLFQLRGSSMELLNSGRKAEHWSHAGKKE